MKITLTLLFFLASIVSYGQNSSRLDTKATTYIDDSVLECLYQYVNLAKTKEPKDGEEEYEQEIYHTILQANTSMSKFWDYNSYKKDSIIYFSTETLPADSIRFLGEQYGWLVKYLFYPVYLTKSATRIKTKRDEFVKNKLSFVMSAIHSPLELE